MGCSQKTKKIYGLTSNTRAQKKNQTEKRKVNINIGAEINKRTQK